MKTNKKSNLIDSLSSSLQAEKKSVNSRFENADKFFEKGSETKENKPKITKEKKVKKKEPSQKTEKVIRDAFSMPASDAKLIKELKKRAIKLDVETNKSELVRAGLHALKALPDNKLVSIINSMPKIKTGRPTKK